MRMRAIACRASSSAPGDVLLARALARVVEEHGEEEDRRVLDLAQELLVALLHAPEILHGDDGVLVDGVAVVEIADHQALDAFELGEERGQGAGLVHPPDGQRGVREGEDAGERGPLDAMLADAGAARGDLLLGVERGAHAVAGDELEEVGDEVGVVLDRLRLAEKDAVAARR